jgi:hypothetical protein
VDVKRLRHLEQENGRLKKLVAERDLEIEVTLVRPAVCRAILQLGRTRLFNRLRHCVRRTP